MVGRMIFASRGVSSPCDGCMMMEVVRKNSTIKRRWSFRLMVVADDEGDVDG